MTSKIEREEVLGQFLGDDSFPVKWDADEEKNLFWVYDDLHNPQIGRAHV